MPCLVLRPANFAKAVRGRKPTADSTTSLCNSTPFFSWIKRAFWWWVIVSIVVSKCQRTPTLANSLLSSSAALVGSRRPSGWLAKSITSTAYPPVIKSLANSVPIKPAPKIAIRFLFVMRSRKARYSSRSFTEITWSAASPCKGNRIWSAPKANTNFV